MSTEHSIQTATASEPSTNGLSHPTSACHCGYELIYIGDGWEHDAAPSLWGNDHDPHPVESDAITDMGREDESYTWSEGSILLAGVCQCADFSCEGNPCVNRE